MRMKRVAASVAVFGALVWGLGTAPTNKPAPVFPDGLRWASPPGNPAVQGAWVVGSERNAGPYLFRVKMAAGGRIPPHTHPDERSTTVLEGTIFVGFGETFDEAKGVAIPAGAVYVAPSNVAHYVWAKEAAVYQEAGAGPTATAFIKRSSSD